MHANFFSPRSALVAARRKSTGAPATATDVTGKARADEFSTICLHDISSAFCESFLSSVEVFSTA